MRATILVGFLLVACGGDGDVSRTLGARCEVTDDCADRCLGPSNDYPDGFCSIDCSTNGDCPSDADCVDREGGVCLFSCRDARDCSFLGPNWTCAEANLRSDQNMKVMICRGN
jgi:hypothetical protein